MTNLRLRLGLAITLVLVLGFLTVANFVPEETRAASPLLPDDGLRLGLDLQGGIHWVLGVKLEVAEQQELDFLAENLRQFDEGEASLSLESARATEGRLEVVAVGEANVAEVRAWAERTGALESVSDDGTSLVFGLEPSWREEVRRRGMEQVLEVLRRRITDPATGIPESVVTRQGDDRVLVQIPGGQIDRTRARTQLKVTGFLEFKIVKDSDQTEELLGVRYDGGLPESTEIAFERDKETDRVLRAYLVDARVNFDRQNRPLVEFRFNTAGAKIFGDLTADNVGELLAIVLDDRVYSAPVIRSQIGRRGQIEGRFTSEEARNLAIVLRAGSLPVPVVIEEERTIGPALGADSIRSGVTAAILGLILVVAFSLGYYRLSGGYASFALLANLLMLIGIMSLFRTTLTLPGIAGLVLTVGMAVDANVIIFERIREELRGGRGARAAVSTGFSKALWTILDANITTLITALVLFQYGTGPIKGFAVTLSVGILTSVFAALVVTRLAFAVYPGHRPVESLSI